MVKCKKIMKKNMTLNEEILNGYTIETINPETGEVQWFELKNGRKFTRKHVKSVLEDICGWSQGKTLLFRENGNLVDIMNENHDTLATVGKSVADSFRKVPYAKFIN